VLAGTQALLARTGVEAGAVSLFIHGTTLAVNTLLQRTGDPVGLIVTRGFRDLLELRRLRLREAQNYFMEKPEALVPRHLVREVSERLLATGERYRPLVPAEVEAAADDLVRAGCGLSSASSTATSTVPTSARRPGSSTPGTRRLRLDLARAVAPAPSTSGVWSGSTPT
jgi:N-methylhydantoinase A/oxoprolinase/acetone carboxylase beta subunit